ncbi:hypothetical protein [Photobacterium damselae]|uniref:hypothetical protein n=1 Tax=Photobacterium damselae TaxID=38293 RepID=UPI00406789D5
MNNIPVLLVFFNRLEPVKVLIDALREIKPKKVYLASDGPRVNILQEELIVNDVRDFVVNAIDWPCEIFKLFNENNYGCKVNVDNSIKWFFSKEDSGIILEDDCIPSIAFFDYCNVLLREFKDNKEVGSISGRNELGTFGDSALIPSTKFVCWGWATWSDRVENFDIKYGYEKKINVKVKSGIIEYLHLSSMIGAMNKKQVNSWAFSYDLQFRKKNQICIVPNKNLIRNIGYEGTHSASRVNDDVDFFRDNIEIKSYFLDRNVGSKFVNNYILKLYPWYKLILLSQIKYLYYFRRFYKKMSGLIFK